LWTNGKNLPVFKEPKEVLERVQLTRKYKNKKQTEKIDFSPIKKSERSYFSKTRMYRIDQASVAQFLNILRKELNLKISHIMKKFPPEYKHTINHWFRNDFSGSIPLPEDITALSSIMQNNTTLFGVLSRRTLKFQSTKVSIKGRNPGDFIENFSEKDLVTFLKKTYMPPAEYIKKYLVKPINAIKK